MTLSFSLGPDPVKDNFQLRSDKRTGKGASAVLVYHDLNNNKVFDEDDTPLPEVKVIARQAGKRAETDASGVAYLYDLQANKPTDVEIDLETLEDPFWHPTVPGVSIVPRSGQVSEITFPVVTTGEIDGTVYFIDNDGFQETITGAVIEILDDEGEMVQSVSSEYDGFYLFEKVIPGTYTLRIHPNATLHPQYSNQQQQINIWNDGTIASGHDILLRDKNALPEIFSQIQTPQKLQIPAPDSGESKEKQIEENIKLTKSVDSDDQILQIKKENDKKKNTIIVAETLNTVLSKEENERNPESITIHPLQYAQNLDRIPNRKIQTPEQATGQQTETYGVHLASYKTVQSAEKGIDILAKELGGTFTRGSFRIRQVDLGPEKGIWYRVICGSFNSRRDADALAQNMDDKTEYAKSITVEARPGTFNDRALGVKQNIQAVSVAQGNNKLDQTAITGPPLQNENPPTRPAESKGLPETQQINTTLETLASAIIQPFSPFNTSLIIPLPGGPIPELGFGDTKNRHKIVPEFSSERGLEARRQLVQGYDQLTKTRSSKHSSVVSI